MAKLRLTVACGDYDIVRPLKEGVALLNAIQDVYLSKEVTVA